MSSGDTRAVRAWLGLGGNIGEPVAAMAASIRALDAHEEIAVAAVSSLYRTPPWGLADQPDFFNAVIGVDTQLSPRALLEFCLETERTLKRVRAERWGPRLIDIDLLLFADQAIDEDGLKVPHPRMAQRAFVLAPLAEIAPQLDLDGQTISQRLSAMDRAGIERLPGGRDWWR